MLCWCLVLSLLYHILWPSSVVISLKPAQQASARPMMSHWYCFNSLVSSFTLLHWCRVRTFHVPIVTPSVGSLMGFAPFADLSPLPWSFQWGVQTLLIHAPTDPACCPIAVVCPSYPFSGLEAHLGGANLLSKYGPIAIIETEVGHLSLFPGHGPCPPISGGSPLSQILGCWAHLGAPPP